VIRSYQVDPKNVDKILASAKNGFLPLVTHLPGFASYSMLDAGNGTVVTISGFTTSSGSAESTKAAASYIKEHLAALVPTAPEVTSGEVKLLDRGARGNVPLLTRISRISKGARDILAPSFHLPRCLSSQSAGPS
jgi:hypothetical protein